MGELSSAIASFLGKSSCKKLIKYDKRTLEIDSLSADYAGAKFSLGNVKTSLDKLQDASEQAAALDDWQYNMCEIIHEYDKNDPERKLLNRWRVLVIGYIEELRVTMAALEKDSSEELKKELESEIQDMRDFVRAIAKVLGPAAGSTTAPSVALPSLTASVMRGSSLRKKPAPALKPKVVPNLLFNKKALSDAYRTVGLTPSKVDEIAARV